MYTLTKLSLAAGFIILMAFVAEILSVLDSRYTAIIMVVAATIQMISLFVLIAIVIMRHREIRGVRIVRYQFSNRFINMNEYILPEHISITNPGKSAIFKIFMEAKHTNESPEIEISNMSVTEVISDMKDRIINNNSRVIDNNFIFDVDITVKPGEKINFQLKKDTFVNSFLLGEFYIP
jgi:hypothetical protein